MGDKMLCGLLKDLSRSHAIDNFDLDSRSVERQIVARLREIKAFDQMSSVVAGTDAYWVDVREDFRVFNVARATVIISVPFESETKMGSKPQKPKPKPSPKAAPSTVKPKKGSKKSGK